MLEKLKAPSLSERLVWPTVLSWMELRTTVAFSRGLFFSSTTLPCNIPGDSFCATPLKPRKQMMITSKVFIQNKDRVKYFLKSVNLSQAARIIFIFAPNFPDYVGYCHRNDAVWSEEPGRKKTGRS